MTVDPVLYCKEFKITTTQAGGAGDFQQVQEG